MTMDYLVQMLFLSIWPPSSDEKIKIIFHTLIERSVNVLCVVKKKIYKNHRLKRKNSITDRSSLTYLNFKRGISQFNNFAERSC